MTPERLALVLVSLALAGCSGGSPAEAHAAAPASAARPASQEGLELSGDDREHMGLELAPARSLTLAPERPALGRVVHDPGRTSVLRAPFAGTLSAGDARPLPGQRVEPGQVLFRLRPRWTPQELADLGQRRASAQAERTALAAERPALQKALERARALNAQDKSVSDRDLEAAERELAVAEARLAGVDEVLRALSAAAAGAEAAPLALATPAAGEVTELAARAGESVEAGATLVVVEDFGAPLVALDVPLEGSGTFEAASARVSLGGPQDPFLTAIRVGPASESGSFGPTRAVLFRIQAQAPDVAGFRPGLPLIARVPEAGPAREGLVVPRSAVVRLAGRAFVYVEPDPGRFERRALELTDPVDGGWFVERSWAGAQDLPLVVRGAQTLLSFELQGRQGEEEE